MDSKRLFLIVACLGFRYCRGSTESSMTSTDSSTASSEISTASTESPTPSPESSNVSTESSAISIESSPPSNESSSATTEIPTTSTDSSTASTESSAISIESSPPSTASSSVAIEVPTTSTDSSTASTASSSVTIEVPTTSTDSSTASSESSSVTTEVPTTSTDSSTAGTESSSATTEAPMASTDSLMASTESFSATTEAPTASTESLTASGAESLTATTTQSAPSTTPTASIPNLQPLSYGQAEADIRVSGIDDQCSVRVDLNFWVPFLSKQFRSFYVCANGVIIFGKRHQGCSVPENQGTNIDFVYGLAPFFADLDLTFTGEIWYQSYDLLAEDTLSVRNVTSLVQDLVREIYETEISPVYIFKATWNRVPLFGGPSSETVTFQVLFVSDGQHSYSIYLYGDLQVSETSLFIGIVNNGSAEGSFLREANINLLRACTSYRGSASFDLTPGYGEGQFNHDVQCLRWAKDEAEHVHEYKRQLLRMPECPCWSSFLFLDRRFVLSAATNIASRFTVPALWNSQFGEYGKTCAYRRDNGAFVGSGNGAGSFQRYNELRYPREYKNDTFYKSACCEQSDHCDIYHLVRPRVSQCYARSPFGIGGGRGDPHIRTLDNQPFTFNGLAEYTLVSILDSGFEIQARTLQAFKTDRTPANATIFTAFAVQAKNSWLQVELNCERDGMILYFGTSKADWSDITKNFTTESFFHMSDGHSLSRDNKTLVSVFSETGVVFNVTWDVGLLQMSIGMIDEFTNSTVGLLGNFNGDPTDDFRPREGSSSLSNNSTDRQIYTQFGQTWMISENESIFKYDDGKSNADYSFYDYLPIFFDEIEDVTHTPEAIEVCGTDEDCLFDYIMTRNLDIAKATSAVKAQHEEKITLNSYQVPTIEVKSGTTAANDRDYLYVTLGESATFTVLGTDDGTLTYQLLNGSAVATLGDPGSDGCVNVTVNIMDISPVYISVTATDDKGVSAPSVDVIIVLCTNCSSHGTCNYSVIRDERFSDDFKYTTCECEPYWEGGDCELDFDGCAANPCSFGGRCTDRAADEHKAKPHLKPYTCGPCPTGFSDYGDTCLDINECSDGNAMCTQECVNTPGSYFCQCIDGYTLADDNITCNGYLDE